MRASPECRETQLRKINQRIPKDLETIVLKCLRKDPGDRYGTAEALRQDLRRFVRGDAVEARPPTRVDRCRRWIHRRRLSIGIASLITFAVAGVAGGRKTCVVIPTCLSPQIGGGRYF